MTAVMIEWYGGVMKCSTDSVLRDGWGGVTKGWWIINAFFEVDMSGGHFDLKHDSLSISMARSHQ